MMNCTYVCRQAARMPQHSFLLCRVLMSDDVDYRERKNALKAVCAHQLMCPSTKRAENSKTAQNCGYLGTHADV